LESPEHSEKATEQKRLRVGLLVDSFIQPRWIEKIVRDIQASSVAEVVLVVRNAAQEPVKKWRVQRYWENRSNLLYVAYTKFDEFKTRVEPDAFESVDIGPLIEQRPVLDVLPLMTKHTDRFPAEETEKIRAYDLDVALRFGFRILKGEVLKIARHGVWSYHHGDGSVNRGGPAGFWEVMEGEPVTGAMLQKLTEELDNGNVIYRAWSPTSDRFSVKANRNNFYWKASTFVMRKLKELAETKHLNLEKNSLYHPYSNRLYKMPTNAEMLVLLSKLAGKYTVSKTLDLSCFNQWSLAYRFKSNPDDPNDTFYKFRHLTPPKDRFWADPFPLKSGEQYFIFLEEYVYSEAKGYISVMEVDRKGVRREPFKVLEKEYHLSYPFVFEWEGHHYMIPETASNRTVELYRCASFPGEWKLERVLLDNLNATDATLIEKDGLWWMFVNVGEESFPSDWDELYLFYADRPVGPWKPHRRNPVKRDVKGSRPAGRLFYHHGELYRPAQDSSRYYGYAISINRVVRLDASEFIEEEVSKILPRWKKNVMGTHTINSADDLTVIDCLVRRSKFL
jgi:hypothetical protein